MTKQTKPQADAIALDCSSPASETPIELLRYGPPPFNRPTLDELEDAMIENIESMTKEEIDAELRAAGIDMEPAIAKLHAMIEAKKKDTGASEKMIDVWEVWPHYDQSYDYILTDDGHSIESHVQAVVEAWMDMCPGAGEELTIQIKAKEMSRHDYEEQTSPAP